MEIISCDLNQFSVGAISACTVMAIEAALRVLSDGKQALTRHTVEDIIAVGSGYTSSLFPSIEQILDYVSRYQDTLSKDGLRLFSTREIHVLKDEFENKTFRAGILVKPPETIMVAQVENVWVIFDSHSRPEHQGAAFLVFQTFEAFGSYLRQLYPTVPGNDIMMNMLNSYDLSILNYDGNKENPLIPPYFQALQKIVTLEKDAEDLKQNIEALSNNGGGYGGHGNAQQDFGFGNPSFAGYGGQNFGGSGDGRRPGESDMDYAIRISTQNY
eukprot:TRINITY_DN9131_c0_g1_i1.p1 TRINITY_DN9131_c0_g1~~TRINITY_DN9131_c0_g1_i1.p1  ORF type:complete len:281 (-),score=65.56 TRINITY_DN9131_c0_g1_i1:71-883(-)